MESCSISQRERWLVVRFLKPQVVLSWAVVGGGRRRAEAVAWYQVNRDDLKPPIVPAEFLKNRLEEAGLQNAVGLLTSWNLDSYIDQTRREGELEVRCLATVGLSNALRVGDPPSDASAIGTINLLCHISTPLSEEAELEALAIAAEARAAALIEASVESTQTGKLATGTGTDCIVIAAPEGNPEMPYAGKHTLLGHLLGAVVMDAVIAGVRK